MDIDTIRMFVGSLMILLISITIHEFSHAITADRLGDSTPRWQGRVTLSPLAHLDPVGTLMIVMSSLAGFGIGWGRPVMVQPNNFRKATPRAGMGIVAIAGPVSNVILAAAGAIIWRLVPMGETGSWFFFMWVLINLALALFNMIPVFPLDGYNVFIAVLDSLRQRWAHDVANLWQRQAQFGPALLMLLIFVDWQAPALSPLNWLMDRPLMQLLSLFLGI